MTVTFEDFKKLEIKIGKILSAEPVEGSEKLLRLQVDFNEFERQIIAGIAKFYSADELVGRQLPFIVNLESREIMGVESQGMLMAVDPGDGSAVLLTPDKEVRPGSIVL